MIQTRSTACWSTRKRGFTIIELLVVISIIALLISILLPSLATARDRARFIKWAGYSHSLRADTRLRILHNFEQQDGTETNNRDNPELWNRANGDPFEHANKTTEPEDWNGEMGADGVPTTRPEWSNQRMRWKGKGGVEFNDSLSQRIASGLYYKGAGAIPKLTVWAWVRTDDSKRQIISSWDRNEFFRFTIIDDTNDTFRLDTTANGAINDWGADGIGTSQVADDQWHFYAASYSGHNDTKKIFFDGELENTNTTAHAGIGALGKAGEKTYGFLGVGSEASIFNGTPGPTSMFMNGLMDEYGHAHGVYEDSQIEEMYRVGKPRERR